MEISKIPFAFPRELEPSPAKVVPWTKIYCDSLVVVPEEEVNPSLVPDESGLILTLQGRVLIKFIGYFTISPSPIGAEGFVSTGMSIFSGGSLLVSTGDGLLCVKTPTTATLHDVAVWDRGSIVGNAGISVTATLLDTPPEEVV